MMNSIDQGQLLLTRAPEKIVIPIELIRVKKTAASAFAFSCDVSGLEDKEIYIPLEIDKGYFSNIKSGKATLQGDLIKPFVKLVGNTIYPEWIAYQIGCTLVEIETETQRQLRLEIERNQQLHAENMLLKNLIQGKSLP